MLYHCLYVRFCYFRKKNVMIYENDIRRDTVTMVAHQMLIAARTAPKGRGRDTIIAAMATEEERHQIAEKMEQIASRENMAFFARDAANLRMSDALILLGTRVDPLGLKYCGYCGFDGCGAKNGHPAIPCAFNLTDLGIALGSAVAVASQYHVDNRIMYSAGRSALDLGLFEEGVSVIFAIPLSVSSKSPYFDR